MEQRNIVDIVLYVSIAVMLLATIVMLYAAYVGPPRGDDLKTAESAIELCTSHGGVDYISVLGDKEIICKNGKKFPY